MFAWISLVGLTVFAVMNYFSYFAVLLRSYMIKDNVVIDGNMAHITLRHNGQTSLLTVPYQQLPDLDTMYGTPYAVSGSESKVIHRPPGFGFNYPAEAFGVESITYKFS